eukprot:4739334-Pleurochrysis_carterae.AAC.1
MLCTSAGHTHKRGPQLWRRSEHRLPSAAKHPKTDGEANKQLSAETAYAEKYPIVLLRRASAARVIMHGKAAER